MTALFNRDAWVTLIGEEPGTKDVMLKEVRRLIIAGDVETAKVMLRTLITATCGFPVISGDVGRNPKSIMRMLTPDTDPGIKAFMAVVNATERQLTINQMPDTER
ncbi:hypothetical protein PMPD1_2176 [Paramixta manurensis]|uniref:Uncharacterized protein n=1 Tax=Paramixta manurensis TaxID=2740817 RepID=A0A6M8UDZ1_9GAMM|nr:hypothetical protein PMPD1_2176 [Erwiniaceae bacterium PD-1]